MNEHFLLEKLSDINYRIATHNSIAMERLSIEAHQIFLLPEQFIPKKYRNDFEKLIQQIKVSIKGIGGRTPPRIKGIKNNKEAIRYIKLLIDIEDYIINNL